MECVPDPTEKPTDLWEVPQVPLDLDAEKCEALVTQESMYMSSDRFVLNEGKSYTLKHLFNTYRRRRPKRKMVLQVKKD